MPGAPRRIVARFVRDGQTGKELLTICDEVFEHTILFDGTDTTDQHDPCFVARQQSRVCAATLCPWVNAPRFVSSGKRHGLRHSVRACTFILLSSCRARTRAKWAMSILAVAWCDGDIRRNFLLTSLYASLSVGSTEVSSGSSEELMSLEMCMRSAESMGIKASGSCRRYSCVHHAKRSVRTESPVTR